MYYIFLALAVLSLIGFFTFLLKKIRPFWKKLLGLLISLAFVLIFSFLFVFPPIGKIYPEYVKDVGSEVVFIKHPTTYKNYETEEGIREVPIRVWFPKDVKNDPLPVFIFSHGSFGTDISNEVLFKELAANGFIVLSLSHPYHSFVTKLSNGKSVRLDQAFMKEVISQNKGMSYEERLGNFRRWVGLHVEDMKALLDEILAESLPEKLNGRIDSDNIFLSGHSLGGAAALEVGRNRSDIIKAVVSLEAPFFGDIIDSNKEGFIYTDQEYPIPVLHFYSDALWDRLPSLVGSEYDTNVKLLDANPEKFINIHVEGAGHLGLTDLMINSPFIASMIDGNLNKADYKDVLRIINSNTLKFLNKYSK